MPRSNSLDSSGASLTSDEDNAPVPVAPVPSLQPLQFAPPPAEGTMPFSGSEKFRQVVTKVINMNKFGGARASSSRRDPGSEPGVDPRRATVNALYSHVHELCEIEVVDYSASKVEFNQYENEGFLQFIAQNHTKPTWAKVRWINIAGISWDILSSLALAYDLHPLTLENILHGRHTSRSKADYYQQWLFIHILCQSLADSQTEASPLHQTLNDHHDRVASPTPLDMSAIVTPLALHASLPLGRQPNRDPEKGKMPKFKRENTATRREAAENRIRAADRANDALRKTDASVDVDVKNLFIYLGRDGTVISIHAADRGFGDAIYRRLRQGDGILRSTGDASLLLQALLDLVVDRAIDIVDRFHESILKMERQILLHPKMRAIRDLHLLSLELTQRRRELDPVKTLIYGLRRYDSDRAVAATDLVEGPDHPPVQAGPDGQHKGFLSHKAKVYLADVHEHADFIMTSLELFENVAENLINYSFNVIAYETNEVMRRLTLATITFAPLTLITGYFGMNFDSFPAIHTYPDTFVWTIGIPSAVACLLLFMWEDIVKLLRKLSKMAVVHRIQNQFF